MKAILLNGKYAGQYRYVDNLDDIKFSQWKCDTFPSKSYLSEVIYTLYVTVNLGKPIAYFREKIPILKSMSDVPSRYSESSLAQQQAIAMYYHNKKSGL